jgi:hypothetical protein
LRRLAHRREIDPEFLRERMREREREASEHRDTHALSALAREPVEKTRAASRLLARKPAHDACVAADQRLLRQRLVDVRVLDRVAQIVERHRCERVDAIFVEVELVAVAVVQHQDLARHHFDRADTDLIEPAGCDPGREPEPRDLSRRVTRSFARLRRHVIDRYHRQLVFVAHPLQPLE